MAKIVGVYAMRSHLKQTRADAIVTINNDHFNTFFFDKWPTLAIGIAERTAGPNDQTPGMPRYEPTIEVSTAKHILSSLIQDGFDFMSSMDFEIDHGALVPQPLMHAFSIPSRVFVGIY